MVGTGIVMVPLIALVFAFQTWLKRQSQDRQARVRTRMERLTEQMFKILDGTVSGYAVLMVISLLGMIVGAIVIVGIAATR